MGSGDCLDLSRSNGSPLVRNQRYFPGTRKHVLLECGPENPGSDQPLSPTDRRLPNASIMTLRHNHRKQVQYCHQIHRSHSHIRLLPRWTWSTVVWIRQARKESSNAGVHFDQSTRLAHRSMAGTEERRTPGRTWTYTLIKRDSGWRIVLAGSQAVASGVGPQKGVGNSKTTARAARILN